MAWRRRLTTDRRSWNRDGPPALTTRAGGVGLPAEEALSDDIVSSYATTAGAPLTRRSRERPRSEPYCLPDGQADVHGESLNIEEEHPLRVLLVTRFFPPSPEVGARRPANLVRALTQREHEVTVITAAEDSSLPAAPGTSFRFVSPQRGLREVLVGGKRLLRSAAPRLHAEDGQEEARAAVSTSYWRRLALSYAWLPDDQQGFILPAAKAAIAELKSGQYDVMLTTAPPFSAHLVGLLASAFVAVPWVAEFRDPWIYEGRRARDVYSSSAAAVDRWLERVCLRRSSEVIAVSQRTASLLRSRRAQVHRPAPLLALNGIESFAPPRPATRAPGPVRVLHAGSLYGGRDPRPFFETLARLRNTGRLPAQGLEVDFVGDCEEYQGTPLRDIVGSCGLGAMVTLHGRLPHPRVVEMQSRADLLLLLAQKQPLQVPQKLYEYLGAARPILAYADEMGETTEMLRHVGGHFVVTERNEDGDQVTQAALAASISGWCPSTGVLAAWATDAQLGQLVQDLEHRFSRQR